jgi:diaminohydroxyphosphoribosylaminopyrimidine deaminase/5-amino-6-(5-phosphoribosylamino)uracil reductase
MFSADDYRYMAQALRLAELGVNTTQPNPRVGCVIVKHGDVVGQGWHQRAGQPHAEILALQDAGEAAKGATLYVTLEPCSHYGRTPPCSEALVASGVARVVVAMQDPNPLVAGRGVEQLLASGIDVQSGLLGEQARELNRGFVSRMERRRPWLTVKYGASLDGRTAMRSGESQWITGDQARQDVQRLRARSCAIMTGSGTVLADDPSLTVRLAEVDRQPLRVVLDSHLSTPPERQLYSDGLPLLLVTAVAEDDTQLAARRQQGIPLLVMPDAAERIDLRQVLEHLASEYEINEVLVEAGAVLNGSLLAEQLVDEILLYMAPVIMGSDARGLFEMPALQQMSQRVPLELKDVRAVGQDWRITARPVYRVTE